ncbi:hypothetical protein ACI2LC_17575 [Nonomuraea wenchangensis]|uniref:hypothetical protein n=1 Tax=Nonomuraea wenchangensis TaxID=568860 RepID=UPI00384D22D0
MHHRTGVTDDATSTPACAAAETAQTSTPDSDRLAFRFGFRAALAIADELGRDLRELDAGDVAELLTAQELNHLVSTVRDLIAQRGTSPASGECGTPWCVEHEADADGYACTAPDEPGGVRMAYDTTNGHLIHLTGKIDGLTLAEAAQLADGIHRQVLRARRASR